MDPVIPPPLKCPITQDIMKDPVTTIGGHTYDRPAITQWINNKHSSPFTRQTLTIRDLKPNYALKEMIDIHHALVNGNSKDTMLPPISDIRIDVDTNEIPVTDNTICSKCNCPIIPTNFRCNTPNCKECLWLYFIFLPTMAILFYIGTGFLLSVGMILNYICGGLAIAIKCQTCCLCWSKCWIPCWAEQSKACLGASTFIFTGHVTCCKCCISCCGYDNICCIPNTFASYSCGLTEACSNHCCDPGCNCSCCAGSCW